MAELIQIESVHERIAIFLKRHLGKPVNSEDIAFVANATERQADWHKRLRELRYPVIGLTIVMNRKRTPGGSTEVFYTLRNWRDLPPDVAQLIRQWEKTHKTRKA